MVVELPAQIAGCAEIPETTIGATVIVTLDEETQLFVLVPVTVYVTVESGPAFTAELVVLFKPTAGLHA
jgi:hypothetical protein